MARRATVGRLAALSVAAAALLTACSDVVSGTGHAAPSIRPPLPTAPPVTATGCPHVAYPAAKLRFDCITSGLTASYYTGVWPLSEHKTVERATQWVLEEGAGHWGSPQGLSLGDIAGNVRQRMIEMGGYGESPMVTTVASRPTTVDGAAAYLLQTTFTLDPQWARQDGTRVKQEKLWILAIEVARGDVSLWYTSVPDLAKSLWAKVPATIGSIQVG